MRMVSDYSSVLVMVACGEYEDVRVRVLEYGEVSHSSESPRNRAAWVCLGQRTLVSRGSAGDRPIEHPKQYAGLEPFSITIGA